MTILNRIVLVAALSSSMLACTSESHRTVVNNDEKKPEYVPIGKPSAPITMQYKVLNSNPKPGEEITIEVNFNSNIKTPVTTKMTSAKKLSWLNSNKKWSSTVNKSGIRNNLPLFKVVAPKEGIYYIRFVSSIEENGQLLSKPFIIPVQVGDGPFELEPVGEVVTDEKGQRVIIQKTSN